MVARIVGLLLGLLLGVLAHAIILPHGPVGALAPWLSLGSFEPERFFVGAAAAALGAVIFVAALMPKNNGGGSGGGGGKRTAPLMFGAEEGPAEAAPETAPPADSVTYSPPASAAQAPLTLATQGASPPPAAVDPAPGPVPDPGEEGFLAVRQRLHDAARMENWTEAAALSRRLPALAANDVERAQAAQDAGDLARGAGAADEAADAYHDALSYARTAAAEATMDSSRRELLAGVLTNVGDIAQDEGRLDAAVEAYEEALALRRAAVAAGPADPPALRALSLSLERLADAREDRGHRMRALDLYKESFDIAGHLAAADPARYGADLASTRERLGELEARIAG
jgi:hypothetical protein